MPTCTIQQPELPLDLADCSRRIRVAPSMTVSATRDGQGLVLRPGAPTVWIDTRTACAILGMDPDLLYRLGHSGEIEGRQPNKPFGKLHSSSASGARC